jgi:arylsulfatase
MLKIIDGEKVGEGRIDKTQPGSFSADETADVGIDESTQVVSFLFKDMSESEFTGYVKTVLISIPDK